MSCPLASSLFRAMTVMAAVVGVAALSTATGCDVEDTRYVGPEALKGKEPPPPSQPVTGGPVGDAGLGGPLCNGAGPIEAGVCAKSWRTDVYEPLIKAAWKCTNEICHLEKSENQAAYAPPISDKDPSRAWNQLVAFMIANKRYVDPCTTDPAVSAISCNVVSPHCGTAQMPFTGLGLQGVALASQEQLNTLATWLTCGAPNN